QPRHAAGIDLLRDRVRGAARRCPPDIGLFCSSAVALPFRTASFDLVTQFMVFTSILDADVRRCVAEEMVRVLTPAGVILWYDFCVPNPRNPDLRPVKAAEIRRLFPGCSVELNRVTLAPPVARLVAPLSWTLCLLLNLVTPLRTHYLGVIRRQRFHADFMTTKTLKVDPVTGGGVNARPTGAGGVRPAMGSAVLPPS